MAGKTYVSTLVFKAEDRATTTIKKLDKALGSLQDTASKLNASASAISQVSESLGSFGVASPGVTLVGKSLKEIGKVKLTGVSKSLSEISKSTVGVGGLSKQISELNKELGGISKLKLAGVAKETTALNKAIKQLSSNKLDKVANSLKSIAGESRGIAQAVSDLSSLGKSLESVGKAKLTDAVKAIGKIGNYASKLEKTSLSVKSLSDALSKLCHSMECVQTLEKALGALSKTKLGGLSKSIGSLSSKAKQLEALAKALKGLSGAAPDLDGIIKPLVALSKIKSFSKLANGLKKLDKALDGLKADLTGIQKLSVALKELCEKADCIKALADAFKIFSSGMRGLNGLVGRVDRLTQSINRLGGAGQSLGGFASLRSGLGALGGALGVTGLAATAFTAVLVKLGFEASKLVGVLAKNVVQSAIDVESQFAGVLKTTDGLGAGIESLTQEGEALFQQLRDISKEKPFSFEDLASVTELGGQLGVATDALDEFAITMKELDIATNLNLEKGTQQVAQFMNVMGTAQVEVGRLGSTLVDLGNNSATTERDIMNMAQRIASAGASAGMSEADILAVAAAFSSVGVKAEAGGTAIQKVWGEIPNHIAEGGAKLELLAKTAGMTSAEFQKAWETDAAGAFSDFVIGLQHSGGQGRAILQDLFGKSSRLETAFMSMTKAGNLLPDMINRGNQAWKENTALTREAEARYNTTSSRIQVLINRIKDLGVTFGLEMLPAVGMAVKSLDPLIKQFELHAPSAAQKLGNFLKTQAVPAFALIIRSAAQAVPKVIAFGKSMLTVGKVAAKGSAQALVWGANVGTQFAKGLIKSLSFVVKAISKLSKLVSYWLKPHSPPKALPNIDKWGFDAARVYTDSFGEGFATASFDGVHEFAKNAETELSFSVDGASVVSSEYLDEFFAPFNERDFSAIDGFTKSAKDALSLELDGSELELAVADVKIAFTNGIAEAKTFGSVSEETLNRIKSLSGDSAEAIGLLSKDYYSLLSVSTRVDTSTKSLIDSLSDIDVSSINSFSGKLSSALTLDGDEGTVAVGELTQSFMQATKEVEQFGVASDATMQAIALAAGDVGAEVVRIAEIELELNGLEKAEADLKAYSEGYLDLIEISNRVDESTKSVIDGLSQVDVSSIDAFVSSASSALMLDGDDATVAVGQLTQSFMQATKEVEQFGVASDATMQAIALAASDVGAEVVRIAEIELELNGLEKAEADLKAYSEGYLDLIEISNRVDESTKSVIDGLSQVDVSSIDAFVSSASSALMLDGDDATVAVGELTQSFMQATKEVEQFGVASDATMQAIALAAGDVGAEVVRIAQLNIEMSSLTKQASKVQAIAAADTTTALQEQAGALSEIATTTADWSSSSFKALNDVTSAFSSFSDIAPDGMIELKKAFAGAIDEIDDFGSASSSSFDDVSQALGDVQPQVKELAKNYLDLAAANSVLTKAQEELTSVTEKYNKALEPLNERGQAIDDEQTKLEIQERIAKLNEELAEDDLTARQRKIKELEIQKQQLALEKQIVEIQQRDAVDAAENKVDEAQNLVDAQEEELKATQSLVTLNQSIVSFGQEIIDQRKVGYDTLLAEIKSKKDALNKEISGIQSKLALEKTIQNGHKAGLALQKQAVIDAQAEIKVKKDALNEEIAGIQSKLALEKTIQDGHKASLALRRQAVTDAIAEIKTRKDALNEEIAGIQSKLALEKTIQDGHKAASALRIKKAEDILGFNKDILGAAESQTDAVGETNSEVDDLKAALELAKKELEASLAAAEDTRDVLDDMADHEPVELVAEQDIDAMMKAATSGYNPLGLDIEGVEDPFAGFESSIKEMEGMFDDIFDFDTEAFDELDSLFSDLTVSIDTLSTNLGNAESDFNAATGGIQSISNAASEFLDGAGSYFTEYFETGIVEALTPSEETFDGVKEWLHTVLPDAVSDAKELWGETWKESGASFASSILPSKALTEAFVADGMSGILEVLEDQFFDNLTPKTGSWGYRTSESFVKGFNDYFSIELPGAVVSITDLFAYWFEPNSPPRALSEIDLWGLGAAEAYINGFVSFFSGTGETLGAAVGDYVVTPLTSWYGGGVESHTTTSLTSLSGMFTQKLGEVGSGIATSVNEEWLPGFVPLTDTFVTGLPENLATMQTAFTTGFGDLSTSIATSVNEEWLPGLVPLADVFVTGLPEDLSTMQTAFTTGFEGVSASIATSVNESWLPGLVPLADVFVTGLPEDLSTMQNSFTTGFKNIADNMSDRVSDMMSDSDDLSEKFKKAIPSALLSLKKSFETEFPILSNIATESLKWIGDSADAARKYIKSLEKRLRAFYDWITSINIPNPFGGWTDTGSQPGYSGGEAASSPPSYDVGTSFHPGGLAYVHQDELIVMPPGSRVYTKAETANLISQALQNNVNANAPATAQQVNATFVFQVETPLDVEEVAYEVMTRVKEGIYA